MHRLLQQRGLRLVMAANLISMVGSGMNMAAAVWPAARPVELPPAIAAEAVAPDVSL